MDEIISQFLLYFVPPEYVYNFHKVTAYILSKRYDVIKNKINEKKLKNEENKNDNFALLHKLGKQIRALKDQSITTNKKLTQTVEAQWKQQTIATQQMKKTIDERLKNIKIKQMPIKQSEPAFNQELFIQKFTNIIKENNKKQNEKEEKSQIDNPFDIFIQNVWNKFDENKEGNVPLYLISKMLDCMNIIGTRRLKLNTAFDEIAKYTDSQIYKQQFLSTLQYIKETKHVNMDEIISQFLLYFVPPEYVYNFHKVTAYILSKRYDVIKNKINEKKLKNEENKNDNFALLHKLGKQIRALKDQSITTNKKLTQTVEAQWKQQTIATQQMKKTIDERLKNIKIKQMPIKQSEPAFNQELFIQKFTNIIKENNKKQNEKEEKSQIDNPFDIFIQNVWNKFDENKEGNVPLYLISKMLDCMNIIGTRRLKLNEAFDEMAKYTDSQIYKQQFLSTLQNIKETKPLPPPPPRVRQRTDFISKSNSEQAKTVSDNRSILSSKEYTPTMNQLLNNPTSIQAWAWQKGDNFFVPNEKRFIIICDNVLYWSIYEQQEFPNGGLNLLNDRVHITRNQTTLTIKSSNKERIFNFGDTFTANKFYDKISSIQQSRIKPTPKIAVMASFEPDPKLNINASFKHDKKPKVRIQATFESDPISKPNVNVMGQFKADSYVGPRDTIQQMIENLKE